MNVGDLKKALEGVSDDMLISVESQGDEVVATDAGVMPASKIYGGVWDSERGVRDAVDTFWVGVGGVR